MRAQWGRGRGRIKIGLSLAPRFGREPSSRVYIPDPVTKWDEALDLVSRGLQFYRQGHAGAAVVSFTEALEVDPKYADAYHHRGSVHFVRGKYDAAVADFTKAIETDYRSTAGHYHARGAAQIERLDYDAAVADFTEIILTPRPSGNIFPCALLPFSR